MSEKAIAINAWRQVWTGKENKREIFFAMTGDGSDAENADVEGRPKWAWVRYNEKPDRVSQVLNLRFPGIAQGVPVVIGKQYPHEPFYQILGVNTPLYMWHWSERGVDPYQLTPHGTTHTWGTGNDPAPINTGNIQNGKVVATNPASMGVHAYNLIYEHDGELQTFYGEAIDLTSHVPASGHRYVLVSLDPDTNGLVATDGAIVPTPVPPSIPTAPTGDYPLAVVDVVTGATTITDENIYDYRILFGAAGGYLSVMNRTVATLEAEYDYLISRHVVEGV